MATVVEGDMKVPFSIPSPSWCRGESYSFPWIILLYPWYILYKSNVRARGCRRRGRLGFICTLSLEVSLPEAELHGWFLEKDKSLYRTTRLSDGKSKFGKLFKLVSAEKKRSEDINEKGIFSTPLSLSLSLSLCVFATK